jgi:SNF2 family DNA or RNA helicase
MTDDDRLKNAGWSPNSIRLAMADMDSPADWSKDTKCASDSTTIESRLGLKRSTNPHIGTPNTVTRRDSKVTDLKQTPNFRIGRSSPIDLSTSTVKKVHGSVSFSDELYSKDFDRDDDLFVLTQTFRRQSITTNDTKKSSRFVNRSAHPVDENRNPSSANLSVDANRTISQMKPTNFVFDITSPVNNKSISVERISKMNDSPKALNFDHGSKTDTSNKMIPHAEVMPITAKPVGSQMEKLLLAANLESTLPNGWKLFKHQKEAVTECLRLGRSIMAFDMGLGKTLISLIWAKVVCSQCTDCITVIIVPCTLTEVWKREAEMIGFISIDINRKHTKESRLLVDHVEAPRIFISSWSKIPSASHIGQKYVLIADEAHAMQSTASIRTKSALNLCLHANCLGLILSTGTPMKNGRPSNILPLLQGIKHPVAQNKIEFEKKYCNGRKTKFCAWDVSGASNLEELKCAIGPYLMRKTKV